MGGWFTKLFTFKKEKRILMLGLDGAGKTTILYKLKLGELVTSIPTIGFNVEEVNYDNLQMNIWDIGGQDKIRRLWKHYYEHTDALIFVVDANDHERFAEASEELGRLEKEYELSRVPFLIFANKQDLHGAINASGVIRDLDLHSVTERKWFVQMCSAKSGEGLYEGLDWLKRELNN